MRVILDTLKGLAVLLVLFCAITLVAVGIAEAPFETIIALGTIGVLLLAHFIGSIMTGSGD